MCGRTCLTLQPQEVQCACKYKSSGLEEKSPEWRSEFNCGKKYEPSHNVAPTDVTPVLVSTEHFGCDDKTQKRVIVPMMWGMIPFWHKGDYKKHGLSTNNCRLEHMLESKLYRGPFRRGQRCVVLCEGFYEWQTTKTAKPSERAAYYIYMPQEGDMKIYDKSTWTPKDVKLLKVAGLFDIWESGTGDKIYSYSVITYESNKLFSWLHHRQPAILETEEQVSDWLDFRRVSDEQALAAIRPPEKLCWHQVSNLVNNSRNKSEKCNKPISEVGKGSTGWNPKSKMMQNWLTIRKRKEEKIKVERPLSDDEDDVQEMKRFKLNPSGKSSGETTTDAETELDVKPQVPNPNCENVE